MEKNAKIVSFFYKEWKRRQRSFRSFIKNGKEGKDRSVLLKRTDAQPCIYLLQEAIIFRILACHISYEPLSQDLLVIWIFFTHSLSLLVWVYFLLPRPFIIFLIRVLIDKSKIRPVSKQALWENHHSLFTEDQKNEKKKSR